MTLTATHEGRRVNVADNYRGQRRGNCYVCVEATFHLLGGKNSGWHPTVMTHEGGTHWFLKHDSGIILDPTRKQFRTSPDYSTGRGCGFLTVQPSRRAKKLMEAMLWQEG